jgi:magnesium-transporting ATPase (P-type)
MRYVVENYPPSTHPKLYTKPLHIYERSQRNYRNINYFILGAGLVILTLMLITPHDGDVNNAIAMGYFMAQMLPIILLDIGSLKEFKLMRKENSSTTRKAELQPRRIVNFVSPALLTIAVITYVAFVLLMIYIDQFDFEWFGGYWNVAGMTVMNLMFIGVLLWHMYGKKMNPYQAYEDRLIQIKTIAKIMIHTSIVATVFITVSILLSALDVRHLLPVFLSLYFQLLATIGIEAYRSENVDFDVYKEEPLPT